MKIKGVIFDFNGTLLWDTQLHNEAWDIFLEAYGIHISDEEKHEKIHGKLNKEILHQIVSSDLTEMQIQKLTLEKELAYQKLLVEAGLMLAPGAIKLFEDLKQLQIPFTIATASGIENVEFYIKRYELSKWFDPEKIVYNDGTMKGKPHPDLFIKAMEILALNPQETLIFEDSHSGIIAGGRANAGTIMIVNSNEADYSEFEKEHDVIVHFDGVDRGMF